MGISIEFLILIRVFGKLYEIASESFVFDKFFFDQVVPGGGFEPPTRGFSVHCSTPELPGHIRQKSQFQIVYGKAKKLSSGVI